MAPPPYEHDPPSEPGDFLTDRVVDFAKSGMESLFWQTCEVASLHLTPLGPPILRCLHLSAKLLDSLIGLRDGEGLIFKMTVPGLGDVLPKDFEFVVSARVASERNGPVSNVGVRVELQAFQPFFPDYDVDVAQGGLAAEGVPAVRTPETEGRDPWRIWLAVIGDRLILNLSETLSKAAAVPAADVRRALHDARAVPADITFRSTAPGS